MSEERTIMGTPVAPDTSTSTETAGEGQGGEGEGQGTGNGDPQDKDKAKPKTQKDVSPVDLFFGSKEEGWKRVPDIASFPSVKDARQWRKDNGIPGTQYMTVRVYEVVLVPSREHIDVKDY